MSVSVMTEIMLNAEFWKPLRRLCRAQAETGERECGMGWVVVDGRTYQAGGWLFVGVGQSISVGWLAPVPPVTVAFEPIQHVELLSL